MLDRFDFILFKIVIMAGSRLYEFTDSWGWLLSFLAGVGLPTFYFDKLKTQQEETTTRRLILASSVILFFIGTLSNIIVPTLLEWAQRSRLTTIVEVHYSWTAYLLWPCFFIGLVSHVAVRRTLSPLKNKVKTTLTKQSELVREERTDVRNIRQFLPDTLEYDPLKHINLDKGMFVGLDRNQQAQFIPMEDWQKQHADILGTTGAGKGVASGMLLYQSIMAGEGVFVLDPKNDEWAPHLFKFACEEAKKPFYLIDLNRKEYQLDLFAGINRDQIEDLLVAGFSLAEKGDMADFYRIDDRKAARESPLKASDDEIRSIEALFNSEHVKSLEGNVKAFYGKMEELALVQSINAIGGLNLKDVFDNGGCCYVIGSLRNSKIIIAQRMILIRLFQLAEERDRVKSKPRPIAIFLDELKYHLSKAALEGLGAARDKGVHIIMAHQSIADLKDCPADLNADAVVGAVVENTKFKLVYKLQDPETAEWVSKMSGTILVDDETRQIERNKILTETISDDRSVRLAERYLVDTNMLQNLPDKVSYIFTPNEPPKPSMISPIKVKKEELVFHVVKSEPIKKKTSIDLPNNSKEIQLLSDGVSESSESLEENVNTENDTPTSLNDQPITPLYLPIASYYASVLPILEHKEQPHVHDESDGEIDNNADLLFDENEFNFTTSEEESETTNEQITDDLMGQL